MVLDKFIIHYFPQMQLATKGSPLKITRCWVQIPLGSVWVGKWLVLQTLNCKVPGSNPAGGRIQLITKWRFIAQSLSLSPFRHLDMTLIVLKGT